MMANQIPAFSTFCLCALLLTGCKPDMDPKIIEAQKANAEARCACLKDVDYAGCLARADAEHPVINPEDGYGVKYSSESLEQYDAAVSMSIKCSEVANQAARPE
jgi:hypothetical protein